MQPQRVKESAETFHQNENADGEAGPEGEDDPEENAASPAFPHQSELEDHVPQHLRQLWNQVSETQIYLRRTRMHLKFCRSATTNRTRLAFSRISPLDRVTRKTAMQAKFP